MVDKKKLRVNIFPGRKKEDSAWAKALLTKLKPYIKYGFTTKYWFWNEPDGKFVLSKEIKQVGDAYGPSCLLIGKDIGAILALQVMNFGLIEPAKAIFLGTPLKWAKENNYDLSLGLSRCEKALFLQTTDDPNGSFKELKEFVEKNCHTKFMIKEIPDKDDDYLKWENYMEDIFDFLK